MMKQTAAIVLCLMSVILVSGRTVAGGAEFNYRDRVDNSSLWDVDDVTMRFEFHSAPSGASVPLFTTNLFVNIAFDGAFCAEVGVRDDLFATTNDLYLAVYVPKTEMDEPTELLHDCRRKLMSVPTAIYAQNAGGAPDGFVVRGTTRLLGGFKHSGKDLTDDEGRLAVSSLTVDEFAGDNGSFTNQVSVGGALTMTKSLVLNDAGGRTFTGENATLSVQGLEAGSVTMPESAGLPVPKGLIMMWYGEANRVPTGWALCDGGVHDGVRTPDLTGRFIVGATEKSGEWCSYERSGGARSVKLASAQVPKHGHAVFGDDGLIVHAEKTDNNFCYDASSSASGDSAWFRTGETGADKAHENRPPFKAVFYIMKIK